jgi:hypothetical protein
MNDFVSVVAAVLAAAITGAGAYIGVSLRRQLKTRVSERRLTPYAALWQVTGKAAASGQDSLTEAERLELFEDMTSWYYHDGSGMCMTAACRNIFLKAKANLVARASDLEPALLRDYVVQAGSEEQNRRSDLAVSQLSLLRTRMRAGRTFRSTRGVPRVGCFVMISDAVA